ncbi:MAG: DUF488 family protein [Elusimicrobia bacterium]|nr:DUF488 family protein [Candidatus Obscuribacterium magneticum]
MASIETKSVYEPAESGDGVRVLVMRLWPRGIKKNRISIWLRELAPEYPLLRAFKSGRISWPEFARRYKAGLRKASSQAQLKELKAIIRRRKVTLLCACRNESRCHRSILKRRLLT